MNGPWIPNDVSWTFMYDFVGRFACRAKSIKNKPQVNAVDTEASMIQSLTKQIDKLMTEVKNTKNLEVCIL